jgi:hypothetical protein
VTPGSAGLGVLKHPTDNPSITIFWTTPLELQTELGFDPDGARGLSRIAIAPLERANVPVAPVLNRAGLTQEVIAAKS